MKTKLKCRIIPISEMPKTPRKAIWVLSRLDRANRDRFVASFPTAEEAQQHADEMYPARDAWRFSIEGLDPRTFQVVEGR